MTRNTCRTRARVEDLTEELTIGAAMRLRQDADKIRDIVQAVVQYLTEEYPSQDLYIPSSVTYPVEAIRADFRAGRSVRWLCGTYRISRKKLYQLLDEAAP